MVKTKKDIKYDWDKNVLNKIKDIELTKDERDKIKILEETIYSNPYRRCNQYIKQIDIFFKLYKLGYSAREISNFTNNIYNEKRILVTLKEAGLSRTQDEAQKIGASKRNYGSIRNKMKETMYERNTNLLGSTIEDYIRNKLDTILYEIISKDYEIIIGKNTINILKQYENDIPIIIINNNLIYKIAIEFDGNYWHINNENDEIKNRLLENKGYTLFRINSKATITKDGEFKYKNDLDEKIIDVTNEILKLITQ